MESETKITQRDEMKSAPPPCKYPAGLAAGSNIFPLCTISNLPYPTPHHKKRMFPPSVRSDSWSSGGVLDLLCLCSLLCEGIKVYYAASLQRSADEDAQRSCT